MPPAFIRDRGAIIWGFAALVILLAPDPGDAQQQGAPSPPLVTLRGTQVHTLTSTVVPSQQYVLHVRLPRSYRDTEETFPVIYVLEESLFPVVAALHTNLVLDQLIPAAIVVGITWGGADPDFRSLRLRDLTPPRHDDQVPESGGAERFLLALKTEIIPFVQERFRASDSGRALLGFSHGGLFTLYAMFRETALFDRYVAVGPSISWGVFRPLGLTTRVIFEEEQSYSDASTDLPVRLFMAVGEHDRPDGVAEFADRLRSRSYPGLLLATTVVEDVGHFGAIGEGFARGIRFVFERRFVELDAAILERYVGEYEGAQRRLSVSIEGGHLLSPFLHHLGGKMIHEPRSVAAILLPAFVVPLACGGAEGGGPDRSFPPPLDPLSIASCDFGNYGERVECVEDIQIAASDGLVRREGGEPFSDTARRLCFHREGADALCLDEPPYREGDDSSIATQFYLGTLSDLPFHVISENHFEGGMTLLLHRWSGDVLRVDDMPIPSPNGRRFAVAAADDCLLGVANRASIWRVSDSSTELEWSEAPDDWRPGEVTWIDDGMIEIEQLRYDYECSDEVLGTLRLEFTADGWTPAIH